MASRFKWRDQYDDARDAEEARRVAVDTGTDTPVQRQFAKDADINELVRRFGLLGRVPEPVVDPAYYGVLDDSFDLRMAADRIRVASDRFMALPSHVRKRFHEDPAELLDFLSDERNRDEAVKLGLLKPPPEPAAPAPEPAAPAPGG